MTQTQKHGQMAWDNMPGKGGENSQNSKDMFLKLNPGSNLVRLLTLPYQYFQHKYKFSPTEKGYGTRFDCSIANGSCPVCAVGDKPKRRWLVGVIDRKTSSYKVLDIGWSILKSLHTYASDEDWGDNLETYDIDIVVDPKGGATNYYSCVCKPKKPLSAQDLLIKDSVDLEFLARRTAAPPSEKVEEKFKAKQQEFLKSSGGSAAASSVTDDDVQFPNQDEASEEIPF